jgi:hypothetical protein
VFLHERHAGEDLLGAMHDVPRHARATASIAVCDTDAELGVLGPVVEALRAGRWEVDRLYDSGHQVVVPPP